MKKFELRAALSILVTIVLSACGGGASPDTSSALEVNAGSAKIAALPISADQVLAPTIVGITKVGESRISRTVYDYVYKVSIKGGNVDLVSVIADLVTIGQGTSIVDGRVAVDALAAGATLLPSDTITLRHDRSFPFQANALTWRFAYQTAIQPLGGGVALRGQLPGQILLGQEFKVDLPIFPLDSRNPIQSFEANNITPGGSQPQVSKAGKLTWVPVDADLNTSILRISTTQIDGVTSIVDVPVRVKKTRLVADIQLAGAGVYSDQEGRYVFDVSSKKQGSYVEGRLKIYERFSGDGGVDSLVAVDNVEYSVKTLAAPYSPQRLLPPSYASVAAQKSKLGLKGSMALPDTPSLPFVEVIRGQEINDDVTLRTVRQDIFQRMDKIALDVFGAPVPGPGVLFASYAAATVAQVDASCDRAAKDKAGINGCAKKSKSPVILIHGFNLFGDIGGGTETWGELAHTLVDNGHEVFEFRWNTKMRFEEAAGLLTKLAREVAEVTGKKPWVIAHSFGGNVVHLTTTKDGAKTWDSRIMSWISSNADATGSLFAGIVTLGSPLSGINADDKWFGQYAFGRDSFDETIGNGIAKCLHVTCVQAGAFDMSATAALQRNVGLVLSGEGVRPAVGLDDFLRPGETIDKIQTAWRNSTNLSLLPEKGVHTLVSLRKRPREILGFGEQSNYMLGDGLISMIGQAILPEDFLCQGPWFPSTKERFHSIGCIEKSRPGFRELLDLLPMADALDITIPVVLNGRNYYFAPRAAHTSVHAGFPVGFSDYPYAVAEFSTDVNVGLEGVFKKRRAKHPLNRFIQQIGSANIVAAPALTSAQVTGFLELTDGGDPSVIPVYGSIVDAIDHAQVRGRFELKVAADGAFMFDSARVLRSELGPKVDYSKYAFRMDFGDGSAYLPARVFTSAVSVIASNDRPYNVKLGRALQVVNQAISISDGRTSQPIENAIIYGVRGRNLSESEVRTRAITSKTAFRMATTSGGMVLAQAIYPGDYTLLIERPGYTSSLLGGVNIDGGTSQSFTLLPVSDPVVGDLKQVLNEDFSGSSIDLSRWTSFGNVVVQNGRLYLSTDAGVDTKGKVDLSGSKIVLEFRMSTAGRQGGNGVALIDKNSFNDRIYVQDVDYSGFGYLTVGTGAFASAQLNLGRHSSGDMEYRVTIVGSEITIERGDTLANISLNGKLTLGTTIAGREFSIYTGYGQGDNQTFDWIRAYVAP